MTRTTLIRATLLAVLCTSALLVAPLSALAGTGGVASPATGAATPSPTAVRGVDIATWFGPGFYGRTTACGQTLTPAVVGIANRTLPCGTLVKVSYRGRRLILPVIDRGPYGNNGADWDLTTQAAHALGILDTVRIGARVVGSVPNTPTLGLPPGSPPGETSPAGTASPIAPTAPAAAITGGAGAS
jgi:rare lipoprotein A (peptidoglycan hydrolase)